MTQPVMPAPLEEFQFQFQLQLLLQLLFQLQLQLQLQVQVQLQLHRRVYDHSDPSIVLRDKERYQCDQCHSPLRV